MKRLVDTLWRAPETNVTLCVNSTSIMNKTYIKIIIRGAYVPKFLVYSHGVTMVTTV